MVKQAIHIRKYRKSLPKLFESEKSEILNILKDFDNFEIKQTKICLIKDRFCK